MKSANRCATSPGSHPATNPRHGIARANGANGRRVRFRKAAHRHFSRVASRRARASLLAIDQKIIRGAWDAELIMRERAAPRYAFYPAQPGDAAVVAAAGGTLTSRFIDPVTIYRNEPDD
jgi:hypothetical protein